jgi:SsrA-binding protein
MVRPVAKKASAADGQDKLVCENRRARHNYAIGERFEAGVALLGTEVKSCREGKAHLNDAYVDVHRGEAYLVNGHIAEYHHGNRFNHEPLRKRKLLLHKNEIDKLEVAMRQRGEVAIPLKLYFKAGRVKVEVGVGKGKTHEDRRDTIKERDTRREMDRAMRRGR